MRRSRRRTILLLAAAAIFAALLAAQSAAAAPLTKGDVLAGVGNGQIKEFTPTGTLVQTLDTTEGNTFDTGMCFDSAGNLYATNFSDSSKFSSGGSLLAASFGSGYNSHPESCSVNKTDQIYVGQADGTGDVLKFDTSGNLLDSFDPATGNRGTDFVDLAADQCTLFYNSEDSTVRRFNVCTKTQLPDFATGLPGSSSGCYALRIRLNGEVMVACSDQVNRLDAAGNVIQTYTPPGTSFLFAMNLDPDGTSFWTGDINTGEVWQIDIATGNVLNEWNSSANTVLGGLAVVGEIRVGGPPPGGHKKRCRPAHHCHP
jgi:hypothetical protein